MPRRLIRFVMLAALSTCAILLLIDQSGNPVHDRMLEKAMSVVRKMSDSDQDAIAEAMLRLAETGEPEDIDPEHLPAVLEGLAQAGMGEFATDEEVAAAFRRFER